MVGSVSSIYALVRSFVYLQASSNERSTYEARNFFGVLKRIRKLDTNLKFLIMELAPISLLQPSI
jgi:hypothetical protein